MQSTASFDFPGNGILEVFRFGWGGVLLVRLESVCVHAESVRLRLNLFRILALASKVGDRRSGL